MIRNSNLAGLVQLEQNYNTVQPNDTDSGAAPLWQRENYERETEREREREREECTIVMASGDDGKIDTVAHCVKGVRWREWVR